MILIFKNNINEDLIAEINSRLKKNDSLKFMRDEGGTGILKANHHLNSIGSSGALKVDFINSNFQVELNYAI